MVMKRFKGVFGKKKVPLPDVRERNRLMTLGVKVAIAKKVLEGGMQCRNYDSILCFDAVGLFGLENYCCDAVAVTLPTKSVRLLDGLEEGSFNAGLFVHVGLQGGRFMAWCDISNISMQDMLAVYQSVLSALPINESFKKRRATV